MHSFILLAQAVTLSTCIVAHNNALLALLVSNNFAEIKSNVFKRVSKDNLRSLVYHGKLLSSMFYLLNFPDCCGRESAVFLLSFLILAVILPVNGEF